MKFIFTSLLLLFIASIAHSRYVEFLVNMNNETLSANGIHVVGDFQTAAGFAGGNWNPASTVLTQMGTSGIYHVVVNIPARKKYEYKYVNGDQFYESEYVPEESRVGYLFNDNRWFYLDSLANDTLRLPTLIFSTNAPLTKKLLRFKVGMIGFTVSSDGVHVAGSHNGFSTNANYMYSFDGKTFEYITYLDTLVPSAQFRFVNGNSGTQYETVPTACNVASNREISFMKDTVMPVVCFSSCSACFNGINGNFYETKFTVHPNPFSNYTSLMFEDSDKRDLYIYDIQGKMVQSIPNAPSTFKLIKGNLSPGLYTIVTSKNEKIKIVIQ